MSTVTPSPERIVSLLWLLLEAGRVGRTKGFIRRHIDSYADRPSDEAFEKMFSRDKDLLREIGVPLLMDRLPETAHHEVTEDGEDVRYRIDRTRLTLPALSFTDAERLTLVRARSLWEGSGAQRAVVRALGRIDGDEQWLSAAQQEDQATFGARLAAADRTLTELERLIRQDSVIRFDYRNADGAQIRRRSVRPWLLMTAADQWYLVGWDLDRRQRRMFRVTRFASEPVEHPGAEESPPRPADLDLDGLRRSVHGEAAPGQVRLWLAPGRAQRLRVGAQPVGTVSEDARSGPAGWDVVELSYSRPAEFSGRVASAGPSAVVPADHPELCRAVIRRLSDALQIHQRPIPEYTLTEPAKTRQRESDQDKVAALVDIVGLVNQRGRMSRQELAARLDITPSKLDAHLETLKYCGMPERYFAGQQFDVDDDGRDVRIRQAEDLAGPVQLSGPEAVALVTGLGMVADVPGLDTEQAGAAITAREKIRAVLTGDARRAAETVQAGLDLGPEAALAAELHRAVQRRSVLELTYHAASRDEVTRREVEPLRVVAEGGHAYLQAWCRRARQQRHFRLDRIAAHRATGEEFTPRRIADTGLYTPRGPETTTVLHFAHRIRDLAAGFRPQRTATLADGSVVAEVRLASTDYAMESVAQHGGELRILAPAALADRTVTWLRQALHGYGRDAAAGHGSAGGGSSQSPPAPAP